MAKKRKTRQEKIILQLKRELARQEAETVSPIKKSKPRQEAISTRPKPKSFENTYVKKSDTSALSYNPKLIKKDLLKTLTLTLAILSLEFMLYLRLR